MRNGRWKLARIQAMARQDLVSATYGDYSKARAKLADLGLAKPLAAEHTSTTQAGVTLGALQAQLGAAGQWLALDPPEAGATFLTDTVTGAPASSVKEPSTFDSAPASTLPFAPPPVL